MSIIGNVERHYKLSPSSYGKLIEFYKEIFDSP